MSHDSAIILSAISLPYTADDAEILHAAAKRLKLAGFDPAGLGFKLYKKSIDARKRGDIRLTCSVKVTGERGRLPVGARLTALGGKVCREEELVLSHGKEQLGARPLIVGTGPAGMFCGLILAEQGYSPILIERGGSVADRTRDVEIFTKEHRLNTESNIQFGAGGAGTFSDGKLVTRISDPRCAYVLRTLQAHGAPDDITVQAKPHVGTDILKRVTESLLSEIERLGGEVRYGCRLEGFDERDGMVIAHTSLGEIECGAVVLAVGHSARDVYALLKNKGFDITPKAFSVGLRIEHLQADIDSALYGDFAGDPRLGHAEYTLSDTTGDRGVYTFCMCPGGEIAAASSEDGCLVVNGMSNRARDGKNANSAVAVSVLPQDYGSTVDDAIEFQRGIERAAYATGGSDFSAPIQTVGDFLSGAVRHEPSRIQPTYMGGDVRLADLGRIFPDFVGLSLRRGLVSFGRKIHGFDAPDAVLTGAETRTSSPVRIERGDDLTSPGHSRIYPCGEGAGYAGGITSAAVDGIRVAQAIMERYAPIDI